MVIPKSALSGKFLKGEDLKKSDPTDADFIGEVVKFEVKQGKAYKNNDSEPDVMETQYHLELLCTGSLGEKVLMLNKTNLKLLVDTFATETDKGYQLDVEALVGKLFILKYKVENNKKLSVVLEYSAKMNTNAMSTTVIPIASAKPDYSNIDNDIIDLIASVSFMKDFPMLHKGTTVENLESKLPKLPLLIKVKYLKALSEIFAELELEMFANTEPNEVANEARG